jgi:hypothetical protein
VLAGTRPWDSGKRPVAWSGEARGGSLRDLGFQQESGQRAEGCDVKEEEGEGRRGCFGLFIFATSVPIFFFFAKKCPNFFFSNVHTFVFDFLFGSITSSSCQNLFTLYSTKMRMFWLKRRKEVNPVKMIETPN